MKKTYDYIIVGAGPAGVQLGYYLQKNERDYLMLESGAVPGAFFERHPRHGKLISINKAYTGQDDPEINLRWDWNSLLSDDYKLLFKQYTKSYFPNKKYLLSYLRDYVEEYKINIQYNASVERISKSKLFKLTLNGGEVLYAKRLIMATGVSKAYLPPIPGIESVQTYCDMSINKRRYRNKRVLIIGKGNSAFETADHLVEAASVIHVASPNPIKMAWRTHFPGHLRAVNNNLLDTYQLKSQNTLINSEITKIEKRNNKFYVTFSYTLASGEVETLEYDEVIACTGFQFDASIFDSSCKPNLDINDRFPEQTPVYESTNVKDLWIAGALMQQRDFKKKQSAFIHGFRYNVKFLAEYLESRYHHVPMIRDVLAPTPDVLANKIVESVNRTSALWQQTGYLCDALVFESQEERFSYYEACPTDLFTETSMHAGKHCFLITLEFGQAIIDKAMNPFAVERVHKDDHEKAHLSVGIHPIVRHYYNGVLQSEHHLIEDFENVWAEEVHTQPLLEYLDKEIADLKRAKVGA